MSSINVSSHSDHLRNGSYGYRGQVISSNLPGAAFSTLDGSNKGYSDASTIKAEADKIAPGLNAELETLFVEAQASIKAMTERPSNADMLQLYAHFKQATEGDCPGKQSGAIDFVNRAKIDAWKDLAGQSKEWAMRNYVSIVAEILSAQVAPLDWTVFGRVKWSPSVA